MLEWFKCPDKRLIPIQDCFSKCRMGDRCEPIPYLHLCAEEREWTGTPSTTQLLNGTMLSYLKITQPYSVDPDDMAFAIHGTIAHQQLEEKAKELGLVAELSATLDGRNVADLIETENGEVILTDYKTWGSYRVAKALGIVEVGKQPNPNGETYKSSGKWGKAGSPKMVSVFQQVASEVDNFEAELQLNRYSIMLMELGISVTKMRIHVIVRDGGLMIARSRGVEKNTYIKPIRELADSGVIAYFTGKSSQLIGALATSKLPEPCNNRECWDGIRCRDYCEVAMYCPKGLLEKGCIA